MKFERKTWKMMQVNMAEKKEQKEKEKLSLEDLQDEDRLKVLMSQVLYLTQDDLDRQKKQEEIDTIIYQKKAVQQYHNNFARKINNHLHQKTHFKAATSVMMEDTKTMSLKDGAADQVIQMVLMEMENQKRKRQQIYDQQMKQMHR